MSAYGYDAAYPPPPATVAAAGGRIMAFYLTGNYAAAPVWGNSIRAAGMAALPNYEQAADELTGGGVAGGHAAGVRAFNATAAQGVPQDGKHAIFFSVDVNVPESNFPAALPVFDGINQALQAKYCTHVYGEGALIDYLKANNRICQGAHWLSGSTSFPGYNQANPNVGLVQLNGSNIPGTDQNVITNAAGLHVWWPAGATPPATALGGGTVLPGGSNLSDFTPQDIATIVLSVLTSPQMQAQDTARAYVAAQQFAASQEGHDRAVIAAREAMNTSAAVADIATRVAKLQVASGSAPDLAAITAAVEAGIAGLTVTATIKGA